MKTESSNVGDVMIVGGGISGIQAGLDLATTGYKTFLVEKAPTVGGNMAQLEIAEEERRRHETGGGNRHGVDD